VINNLKELYDIYIYHKLFGNFEINISIFLILYSFYESWMFWFFFEFILFLY